MPIHSVEYCYILLDKWKLGFLVALEEKSGHHQPHRIHLLGIISDCTKFHGNLFTRQIFQRRPNSAAIHRAKPLAWLKTQRAVLVGLPCDTYLVYQKSACTVFGWPAQCIDRWQHYNPGLFERALKRTRPHSSAVSMNMASWQQRRGLIAIQGWQCAGSGRHDYPNPQFNFTFSFNILCSLSQKRNKKSLFMPCYCLLLSSQQSCVKPYLTQIKVTAETLSKLIHNRGSGGQWGLDTSLTQATGVLHRFSGCMELGWEGEKKCWESHWPIFWFQLLKLKTHFDWIKIVTPPVQTNVILRLHA